MDHIKAEVLTRHQVEAKAKDFLHTHGRLDEVPVQIEELVELDLGLEIALERGVKSQFDVDGFLSFDLTRITADEDVYKRLLPRYRFTLAHELGHLILHGHLFKAIEIQSEAEWIRFYLNLSEEEYGWFEHQAYWFAGAILLPRHSLLNEYRSALEKVEAEGFDYAQLSDYSRSTLAGRIARKFVVSTGVVRRRLRHLGLG